MVIFVYNNLVFATIVGVTVQRGEVFLGIESYSPTTAPTR